MARQHAIRHGLLLAFLALACAVGSAGASVPTQSQAAADRPLPIPGAFRLQASNGYTLYVAGLPPASGRPGSVLIFAFAKGNSVAYKAPATVTEDSIQADLGELGVIAVAFHRSGRATSVPCGEQAIRFDSGSYEGTIAFHGEEGFTGVEVTSVPGNVDYWASAVCDDGRFFSEGFARRPRGALLYVRNPGLGQEMSVRKRRPGAAARITASSSEWTSGGISIARYASVWAPNEAFTYDRRLRKATVRPPAPFSGSAQFDLGKKAGQRWSGNLAVDLPGKANVPLTAPYLRAALAPSE